MRAAVLAAAGGGLAFEELLLDEPGADEVVVRTTAVGLCHSDLHYVDGTLSTELPEVLGHEAAGVVESVGSAVTTLAAGNRVVTCITAYCGRCRRCLTGRLSLCENYRLTRRRPRPALIRPDGTEVGRMGGIGAFAEQMLVHERAVVPIGDHMPPDRACLLGCAFVTGIGAVVHRARVRTGDTVAVIGCGGVGSVVIQGARIAGAARIIAIDVHPFALTQARVFGATDIVDARAVDVVDAVRDLTGGGVDHAFEIVGTARTVEQSIAMLVRGGTATVLGLVPDRTPVTVTASELYLAEKRLQGSFLGSNIFPADIPMLVDLYRDGRLLVDEMVSEKLSFDEINAGLDLLRSGGVTRVVVEVGS